MIHESPFPNDVAVHVDLDDGVDLRASVVVGRIATEGDALLLSDVTVGDVERGRRQARGLKARSRSQ